MRKIIIAKETGKNKYRAYKRYSLEKSEIMGFFLGILIIGYVAVRVLIG